MDVKQSIHFTQVFKCICMDWTKQVDFDSLISFIAKISSAHFLHYTFGLPALFYDDHVKQFICHIFSLPKNPYQEVLLTFILVYLFFLFNKFIYLFLAALGLRCYLRAFSSCGERGLLLVVVHGLLIVEAPLVGEHGLQVHGLQQLWHVGSVVVAHGLQSTGSVVVARGLSCSAACGIFPDQGSNLCPLHWQPDS